MREKLLKQLEFTVTPDLFDRFVYDEAGAVTTDYVPMVMVAVSLAVSAPNILRDTMDFRTAAIGTVLRSSTIIRTSFDDPAYGSDIIQFASTDTEDPQEEVEVSGGLFWGYVPPEEIGGASILDDGGTSNSNGNNGFGNGDQDAPGGSEMNNNAENAGGNQDGTADQGSNGNSSGNSGNNNGNGGNSGNNNGNGGNSGNNNGNSGNNNGNGNGNNNN
ncbi:MAG: hypothetical protein ACI8TF_001486 [Paracoccaceae bacterium]